MELGYITSAQLPYFASLMLPEAERALQRAEPVVALGLTEEAVAFGAAVGYLNGSHFEIISLFVAPDYRRRGGGRMLLEAMLHLVKDTPTITGVEISYTDTDPEHKTLAPFLKTMDFGLSEDQGENLYMTTLGQVEQSFFSGAQEGLPAGVLPFEEIPDIYLSMAGKLARLQDAPVPEVPLDHPSLDRSVSCALFREKEVQAFVAFDHSCCGHLTLCCAWSGSAGPTALPILLRAAFRQAAAHYPLETVLVVQAVNQSSAKLVRKLMPGATPISYTYYRAILYR